MLSLITLHIHDMKIRRQLCNGLLTREIEQNGRPAGRYYHKR